VLLLLLLDGVITGRVTMTRLILRMTSSPSCQGGVQQQSPCMAAAGSSDTAGQLTGTTYGEHIAAAD
jgi:hypothetical protein